MPLPLAIVPRTAAHTHPQTVGPLAPASMFYRNRAPVGRTRGKGERIPTACAACPPRVRGL